MFYDSGVNFLAHVYFADGYSPHIVGQLLGDFVRGRSLEQFPADVAQAIRTHRAIDSYTDKHPLSRQARNLFEPPVRRYAGIVVDVIYDHFLARQWDQYCDIGLSEYAALVHAALAEHADILPDGARRFAAFMLTDELLAGNLHRHRIDLTLQRIAARRPGLAPLAEASAPMWRHEDQLQQIFNQFFPQLRQQLGPQMPESGDD